MRRLVELDPNTCVDPEHVIAVRADLDGDPDTTLVYLTSGIGLSVDLDYDRVLAAIANHLGPAGGAP